MKTGVLLINYKEGTIMTDKHRMMQNFLIAIGKDQSSQSIPHLSRLLLIRVQSIVEPKKFSSNLDFR